MSPEFLLHWETARVEDIADRVAMGPFGSSIKVETFVANGIPVISGQHLKGFKVDDNVGYNFITEEHADRLKKANVQRGDVIFTHAGSIGQAAMVPHDAVYDRYVISQRQFYLRCNSDKALPEYVVAYFRSPQGQHALLANSSQVGVPSIARPVTYLRSIPLPLPPLSEQRAIAAVLGALDDKIEQNRRTARALERLARAIFRAWFVDFEPVKAKDAGATAFPSMPQPVFDALPTRFVDSAIGPVPEGWEVKALADVCDLNARSVRKGEIEGEIEYINIASVTRGHLDEIERMDFRYAPSRARRVIQDGDTIWSCVRPNRMSYLYINNPPGNRIVSTGFAVLTPSKVGPSYLYQLTTQPEFVDYLVANATGSAYPAVRSDHFETAKFCCPSEVVLDAFEAKTHPMRRWIGEAERESRRLAEMRDCLLPKLLSGEVHVQPVVDDANELTSILEEQ